MAAPPHMNPHQRATETFVHGPEDQSAHWNRKVAGNSVQDPPYAFFALPGHLPFDRFHQEIEHLWHNQHRCGARVFYEPGKTLWLAARCISDTRSVPHRQKQSPRLLIDMAQRQDR